MKLSGPLFVLLALLPAAPVLAEDDLPLQNWTAPPYWAPPAFAGQPNTHPAHGRTAEGRQALAGGPTALPFISLFPCRLVDTRGNGAPLIGGWLPSATVRSYTLTGVCNVPANAQAISLNVTVVKPVGPGFLTIWPEGGTFPPVSTLNYLGNDVIVNAAVVPLSVAGGVSIALGVSGGDVILDTNGYYAATPGVTSLNTQTGDLTLQAGTNVTLTPGIGTLVIAATGGSGGAPTGPAGGSLAGTYPNPTVVSTSLNVGGAIVSRDAAGGFEAGSLSLASAGMVRLNGAPFLHAFGTDNTFAGGDAGNTAMGGGYNSAFGSQALHSNAQGDENVAFGAWALSANGSGSGNSAAGSYALGFNTVGIENSAFGRHTLVTNTKGERNSAFGSDALRENTTAGYNTAVGSGALYSQRFDNSGIPWGSHNTAIGTYALWRNNPTSTSNGIRNTAVGGNSLTLNTTGSQNTAVGFNSLLNNAAGSQNTAVGYLAGGRTGDGTGYGGGSITFVATTTGTYNTFVGHGTGATADVFNCTAVGMDAYCDGNNQVRLGNAFVGSIGGNVGWSALSDARAKKEIRDLALGLGFVLKLRPVEYKLKAGNERTDMGFLAQDVETLLGEEYNVLTVGGDSDRTLSLRYQDLIAPLVKAVQQQQAMLLKDRDEIRADREVIRALQARLRQLESLMAPSGVVLLDRGAAEDASTPGTSAREPEGHVPSHGCLGRQEADR